MDQIRWARQIVKGSSLSDVKRLRDWWNTRGRYVHGNERADVKVHALDAAIKEEDIENAKSTKVGNVPREIGSASIIGFGEGGHRLPS